MPGPEAAVARPARRDGVPAGRRVTETRIEAALDRGQVLRGTAAIRWTHPGRADVSAICLELHMNSAGGAVTVHHLRADGVDLPGGLELAADASYATVRLPTPVAAGQTVAFEITFTTRFPAAVRRTGVVGNWLVAAQWFPKVAVLEHGLEGDSWACRPSSPLGEFYGEYGTFDLTLDVPADLDVVASGVEAPAAGAAPAGARRWRFVAEDVHDVAWVAAPALEVTRERVDGDLELRVVHTRAQRAGARRHLEAARRTVETLGRWFGPYPWSVLTVVDPPPWTGDAFRGMEYPTLVVVGMDSLLLGGGVFLPEYSTVHEVTHQWFHALVGTDEAREPWLDEGLSEYVGGLVLDDWLGRDRSALDVAGLRAGYLAVRRAAYALEAAPRSGLTASSYADHDGYFVASYVRPTLALATLEARVGRRKVIAALADYVASHRFAHASAADLDASVERVLGARVAADLRAWLQTTATPDYQLRGLDVARMGDRWQTTVRVANVGGLAIPAEVALRLADGRERRVAWDGDGEDTLVLQDDAPARGAWIDPDGAVALAGARGDDGITLDRPARPHVARAAAQAAGWEHALLSLVGP